MRRSAAIGVLIGFGVAALAHGSVAFAQNDVAMAGGRRPQFLAVVAKSSGPVPIDPASVPVLRRRVSLDLLDVSRSEALNAISSASGLRMVFANGVALEAGRVRLKVEGITVAAALTEVLLDTDIDVVIARSGDAVLVRRIATRLPATGTIVGMVTADKNAEKLGGVEVFLEGTRWRATTDTAGNYRLAEVDTGSYVLTARRLGYTKQSRRVIVRADVEDTVNVALQPKAVALAELVTTATGQQRRRDLGNAITSIQADSVLRSAVVRNLTDLLENRVPGMSLQHTSGAPGDPARIRLRGLSSVMRGNDPVVVVDGIRVYATQSASRSGNLTNLVIARGFPGAAASNVVNVPAPSPLDQIDPNIIEKIEVFKGPSAATLYGADAANGVIVITTKRGKPGPTNWSANFIQGRTVPAGNYPNGYYRWGHTALNGGAPEFCPLLYLACEPDSLVRYQALNDPDMTIFGTGYRTAFSLTASGGSQALTYSLTGSYANEIGLLKLPDFEIERFRTNLNREPPDWMRRPHHLKEWAVSSNVTARLGASADVTLSTVLSRSEQQRTSLEAQQAALARTYIDKVNGAYYLPQRIHANRPGDNTYVMWPATSGVLADYYRRTTASAITFTTGLTGNWRPRSWFTTIGRAGLNVIPRDDETFWPGGLVSPTDSGVLTRGTGRSLMSTFDLQGMVRKPLKWGFVFETNLGTNLVTTTTNDLVSSASGLVPGTASLVGATQFYASDSRASTSVFGWFIEPRITGQRLSLSTGIRLDGGSAYGAHLTRTGGGLFGGLLGLPKLNGSWVISEEPWFPFNSLVSSLRLRGAYGQAQVQPGVMDRLRLYTRRIDGTGELLDLDKLGNAELRPERSTEFEGGFDADLLDSRLSVELTGYRKVQVDALMPVSLPGSVNGGGGIIQNIGNIRNTGLEITTRITPVQTPLLTWSATLNYQRNSNMLTKLGAGVEPNPRQGFVAGYPVGGRWSRPIIGFADQNRDGVIAADEVQVGDSLVFMGRLYPAYKTSMFTNLVLFGGTIGVTAGFSYEAGATQIDQTAKANWILNRAVVDPTTPLEQQAALAVYDSTDYGLTQDVSTFRFNSLSVKYRAPARLARLLGAQRLAIAVQGDNLGMHSTYRGKDPDVTAWSPTEHIEDTGQIGLPRTWQLRVDLGY